MCVIPLPFPPILLAIPILAKPKNDETRKAEKYVSQADDEQKETNRHNYHVHCVQVK